MPHYEFFCHACKKTFSKILALVDYEEGGIVCPHCGSHKVEQCWSASSVITAKKSACELSPSTAPKAGIDTDPPRA
jgi:putative FmdB family regulatory protein